MHKLCLHRIKAESSNFALKKAYELLNPINPDSGLPNVTDNTIKNIKMTNLFSDEFDNDLDECLESIFNTESGIYYEFMEELIEMDCKNSADEIENLYGTLMDNTEVYFYKVIGSLSEDNEIHLYEGSQEKTTSLPFRSIDALNKIYYEEFGDFNVLSDLNEIDPNDNDSSISLWELNYEEEKGKTFIVFSYVKLY
jgi:hypothetical protein|uniref:hypothetical protein n=1 Tax=Flavobacterium sp. TaxID=239 RepID=UPI0040494CED